MSPNEKTFLIPPDGSLPPTGFFAVKFGKGTLDRAVSINFADNIWTVSLDGLQVGQSASWQIAFKRFICFTYFIGRRIMHQEYSRIIEKRRADVANGIDIDEPVNLNQVNTGRIQWMTSTDLA